MTIVGETNTVEVTNPPVTNKGVVNREYFDARLNNLSLTGISTVPTAPFGTNTTQIASTAFVQSAFNRNSISQGNSSITITDTGTGNVIMSVDATQVFTATSTGVNLLGNSTAVTQPQTATSAGNGAIATTQYVKTATQFWGGSRKWVSNLAPSAGVNDVGSADGDIWFQIQ
jgi:hypothetical protein